MSTQPESSLLADYLEKAAVELRRLQQINQQWVRESEKQLSLIDFMKGERMIIHNAAAQQERQACAELIEQLTDVRKKGNSLATDMLGKKLAAEIRKRGNA